MQLDKALKLKSDLDELSKLEDFLQVISTSCGLDDDVFSDVMLSITEATANAIVHGNQFDPNKSVLIRCICTNSELRFTIADEGEGFSPNELPNPVEEENLLKSGGRGIFLIKNYSSSVKFNEKGNQITVTFHLNSEK